MLQLFEFMTATAMPKKHPSTLLVFPSAFLAIEKKRYCRGVDFKRTLLCTENHLALKIEAMTSPKNCGLSLAQSLTSDLWDNTTKLLHLTFEEWLATFAI